MATDTEVGNMTEQTTVDDVDDFLPMIDDSEAVIASKNKKMKFSTLLDRKVTTLTIASSAITPNLNSGHKFAVTLDEAITVNAPLNPIDGDQLFIRFIQDSTGSFGVTLNAIFIEGDDVAFANLTTVLSTTSKVLWEYDGGLSKWTLMALANGYI